GDVLSSLNTAGPTATPVYSRRTAGAAGIPATVSFAAVPAAGDIDGDGDTDLVFGGGDGVLRVALNTAGPAALAAFSAVTLNPYGLTDIGDNAAPTLGDVNGDGDMDLLVGRTDGTVAYFENTAGPAATPAFALRTGAANPLAALDVGFSSAPHLVDLDGDGDLDVLVGAVDGTVSTLTNTAGPRVAPAFGAATAGAFGLADIGYGSVPATGDLDGDGDVDVLVGTSPGAVAQYRNDGTAGTLTAVLNGPAGWRLLASPAPASPLNELLGAQVWTQGVAAGADSPAGTSNVLLYDETLSGTLGSGYVTPATLAAPAGAGRGIYVYVYDDADFRATAPDIQFPFPKTLSVTGPTALVDFDWGAGLDAPLTYTDTPAAATDDGWNLLGNPFASWFDWDGAERTGVGAAVYVYDPATAAYRSYSGGIGALAGGIVGPLQGFWVQTTAASPTLTLRPSASSGGPLYREGSAPTVVSLRLRPGTGSALPPTVASEAFLALGVDGAEAGLDALDAVALVPPAQAYVLLSTAVGGPPSDTPPVALSIDARPALTGTLTVPLDVSAVAGGAGAGGPLVLDWPGLALPDGWRATLHDRDTDTTVELVPDGTYAFTLDAAAGRPDATDRDGVPTDLLVAPMAARGGSGRFTLIVAPAGLVAGEPDAPAVLALSAPRPNPTSGAARVRLDQPEAAHVTVSVYDALGRRVAVVWDGDLGAGTHELDISAGHLAPGVYVIRAVVQGGQTLVSRLTVTS
ncbi:MAG TPA: FG-GAP-like repeat-containing protein, partial [Rubricoccaceae bacterium]